MRQRRESSEGESRAEAKETEARQRREPRRETRQKQIQNRGQRQAETTKSGRVPCDEREMLELELAANERSYIGNDCHAHT